VSASTRGAAQIQKTAGIPNGMRTATIAAVNGGVVTISINGGQFTSGVGVLESYTPVVGDTVAVFRQDSSWLVLGSIAASLIATRGQLTGTVLVSFTGTTNSTATTFGGTFPTAPVVTTNIDVATNATLRWSTRAISVSTTGFTVYSFACDNVSNTWSNVAVSWVATARA